MRASQVVLVVKDLTFNARDLRDLGVIPASSMAFWYMRKKTEGLCYLELVEI